MESKLKDPSHARCLPGGWGGEEEGKECGTFAVTKQSRSIRIRACRNRGQTKESDAIVNYATDRNDFETCVLSFGGAIDRATLCARDSITCTMTGIHGFCHPLRDRLIIVVGD